MATVRYDSKGIDPSTLEAAHKAIGEALANWQHVETSLYILFHCLPGTTYENSSLVFFHIKSAENRLSLIDKLCLQHLSQRTYGNEWKDLKTRIRRFIEARNGIAHFEITGVQLEDMPKPRHTNYPIIISPNHLDVSASHSGMVKTLFVETLIELSAVLAIASQRIVQFSVDHVPNWQQHATSLPQSLQLALGIGRKTNSPSSPPQPPKSSPE